MVTNRESDVAGRCVLVAGGGSGGHVFPGLALAAELESRGWTVSLVGRAGQLEERLAGEHGLPFYALDAAPLVGVSAWQKGRTLATTLRSAVAGRRLVRKLGADVVVGLGGYVSVPAVLGARLAGRPALLFEPNATAGVANRLLSRVASHAAVAYSQAAADLVCASTRVGTPVRPEFLRQADTPPPESPQLLILGGSQGARQLNELVPPALALLGEQILSWRIIHQAGPQLVEETRAAYVAAGAIAGRLEVVPFLDDMAGALGGSHLVLSRAGAITLAEICAVGRASLLVPLSIAGGHQADNARALLDAGAAEILRLEAGVDELAKMLRMALADSDRLLAMGRAARGLSRRSATEDLADCVIGLGGGS